MAINLTDSIFTDEAKAREHLEAIRWPDGPFCPHCGETARVYRLNGKSHRLGLIHCNSCSGSFTVTTGSVMESSHVPLNKWVLAYRLMAASKKGMSAHQLHRSIGVTYKTAWFMWHRVREAMRETTPAEPPLGGAGMSVEVDETYVGGKPRKGTNTNGKSGRGTKKTPVVALVERGGRVRSRKIDRVDGATLKGAIRENVDRKSRIVTDEWRAYNGIGAEFDGGHEKVLHSADEFARGDVNTNTVESYFALLKRGVMGSFHHVSKKHLDRYCDEFSFRWNRRSMNDTERAAAIVAGGIGKRLTYRQPRGTQ